MTYCVNLIKIKDAYYNLGAHCGLGNTNLSWDEYVKIRNAELKKFNCSYVDGLFHFETEQDYMFFLLRWS